MFAKVIQNADVISALTGKEFRSRYSPPTTRKIWTNGKSKNFLVPIRELQPQGEPPAPDLESWSQPERSLKQKLRDAKLAGIFKPALRTLSALSPQPASWRTSLPFSRRFQNSQHTICVFMNPRDSGLA